MPEFLAFASGVILIEAAHVIYELLSTRPRPVAMVRNYRSICVDCLLPRGRRIAP